MIRVDHIHGDKSASLGLAVLFRCPLAFIDRYELLPWFDYGLCRMAKRLPEPLPLNSVLTAIDRFLDLAVPSALDTVNPARDMPK